MFVRIYEADATAYRTVGLVDQLVDGAEDKYAEAGLQSIEEYNVECAIVKVLATEAADYVTDEGIQCLGGYGYSSEYPMERYYRDNRVYRIFEGTNEINRVVIATMLLRKGAAGLLPLFDGSRDLSPVTAGEGLLADEKAMVANIKRIVLLTMDLAAAKYGKALSAEQMVLLRNTRSPCATGGPPAQQAAVSQLRRTPGTEYGRSIRKPLGLSSFYIYNIWMLTDALPMDSMEC